MGRLVAFLFRRKGSIRQPSQHLLPSRAMSLRQQHLLPLPLSLPLPPTLPHPSQVLLHGRGLELRQADTHTSFIENSIETGGHAQPILGPMKLGL